jgi:F-type H+-transporting ATPase subunit epsilon
MPLHVEVVSAEEELFSGESDFVAARTVDGDIGVLPGHTPLLARLVEYDIRVKTAEGEQTFPISGGFMTVKDDKVIILAEEKGVSPESS